MDTNGQKNFDLFDLDYATGVLTGIHNSGGQMSIFTEGVSSGHDLEKCKLILRPLSSMTEEEAKELCRMQIKGMRDCDHIKITQMLPVIKFLIYTDGEIDWGSEGRVQRYLNIENYLIPQFKKLLEWGFDIFNLKESGLAIYEMNDKPETVYRKDGVDKFKSALREEIEKEKVKRGQTKRRLDSVTPKK